MKKILIGSLIFFGSIHLMNVSHNCYSQSIPRVKIIGKVVDGSNGKPIHFANVFLANTTMGCATDKNGIFSIVNVPLGTYELVVSMIGYEPATMEIRLKEGKPEEFKLRLKPKVLQAPRIEVEAPYPHEWRRHLQTFKKQFIGTSSNASHCKILNPEVLDFNLDVKTQALKAKASETLQIENRALGYRIYFLLNDFTYRNDGSITYQGQPRFEEFSPKNEKEEKNWRENRRQAFNGSLRHFLHAAAIGDFEDEGFFVSILLNLVEGNDRLYKYRTLADDLLSSGEREFERILSFPYYLRVIYNKEEEPLEFSVNPTVTQTSWLHMSQGIDVTINTSGHIYNPFALTTYGYWAWERIAEALPLDYLPDEAE